MAIINKEQLQQQLAEKQRQLSDLLAVNPQYTSPATTKALEGYSMSPTIPRPSIQPIPPIPQETPIVKFNRALLDMMDRASRGISSVSKQQEDVERMAAGAYKQPFQGQQTLTPAQQLGMLQGAGEEYQPTVKGLSNRITNFEKILDVAKETYGEDFQNILNIEPSKDLLEDYRRAFQNGEDLTTLLSGMPQTTRQKVFNALTNEDYAANKTAQLQVKLAGQKGEGIENQLLAARGTDGYTDPNLFARLRAQSALSASDFNARFGYLVNPASRDRLGLSNAPKDTGEPSWLNQGEPSWLNQGEPSWLNQGEPSWLNQVFEQRAEGHR